MKIPMAFGKSVLTMIVGLFVVVGLSVLPQPLVAEDPPDDIATVVLFATNAMSLAEKVEVVGDVVVNDASPGPTYEGNGDELVVQKNAMITGDVAADDIRFREGVVVSGATFCNALTAGGGGPGGGGGGRSSPKRVR